MRNVKFDQKHFFTFYVFKEKKYKQIKQNKRRLLLKSFLKSLIYLLGGETASQVNFMQPMLVSYSSYYLSSLEGDIANVTKILTSGI